MALCNELEHRVKNDNSLLEHDQYNLLVRLINAALQDDNTVNSTNVAAKIVPLVAAFHRKLGPSVIQFAYTSVQEHSVWSNVHFWEEAFYNEAQRKIVELYANERKKKEKVLQNETELKASETSPSKKLSNNVVPNEEIVANNVKDDSPITSRNSPVVKRTVSETDASKLLADKALDKSPPHRGSLLIAPTSTSLQRSRASTTRSSSSTLVDESEMKVRRQNTLKDLPDAMKLAADLVMFYLFAQHIYKAK